MGLTKKKHDKTTERSNSNRTNPHTQAMVATHRQGIGFLGERVKGLEGRGSGNFSAQQQGITSTIAITTKE